MGRSARWISPESTGKWCWIYPGCCFGVEIFCAWADAVEDGCFEEMWPEKFKDWPMYKICVCDRATNGSCRTFLERALLKNPDMDVLEQYRRLGHLWAGTKGKSLYDGPNLELLGGGFNASLAVLQDKGKRNAVAAVIRQGADCMGRVLDILERNLPKSPV